MPNKYSHALVLSHYEHRGLVDFDQPYYSQSPPFKPSRSIPTSDKPVIQASRPIHVSPRPTPTGRIRISSISPPPLGASRPSLRHRSSSIETQIYAPWRSPSPVPRHELQGSPVKAEDSYLHVRIPSRPSTAHDDDVYITPHTPFRPSTAHDDDQITTADIFNLYSSPSPTPRTDWSDSSAVKAFRRASWASRPSSTNGPRPGSRIGFSNSPEKTPIASAQLLPSRLTSHENSTDPWIEAQAFAPKRPPSPPATPESQQSFSIGTISERPEHEVLGPPPVPVRSSRRTPPRSSSHDRPAELPSLEIQPELEGSSVSPAIRSPTLSMTTRKSDASASSPAFQHQPESLRSRASSVARSPTFSMTTMRSSFDTSTRSSNGQLQSEPLERRPSSAFHSPNISINTRTSSLNATTSPPDFSRLSSMPSKIFFDDDDDADLESLPSTLDFNVTPWAELNAGPAVFCNSSKMISPPVTRPLSMISTRASSFDSAAPPPIRLRGSIVPSNTEKPLPKPPRKSISSMLFSRLGPKAILYSQTTSGRPTVPVSVSRTATPSIPALFPNYKGQFPPPESEEMQDGRRTRDSSISTQVRGRSVPPKTAGNRRKSWFKSSQVDKVLGRGNTIIEKNIQDIIKANQATISG